MTPVRDVAIVGAGLLGLAAGRALAARGRDVLVLEQAEVGHPGSGSKGSARIFRLGYPDPDYVRAARQARDRWHELEAQSGRRILRPVPHLTFGTGLRGVHDAMIAAGAPCQLLQKADVAERFPAITVDGPALLEPDSAVIAADEALRALAAGVPDISPGVRVIRMADDGREVTLHTTAGVITARTAIVTAGPWSSGLLASVSVPVPGRPTLEQVAYFRPAGRDDAPIFVCHDEQTPYGVPVPGSRLYKVGIHPSGPATDPDAQSTAADQRLLDRLAKVARRYLPGYHPEPVSTERCVYDNSPDEDFIIDRIGNIVVGCGTSGHGFKFGPLLGEWLADLVTSPAGFPARQGLRLRFALERFGHPD
ncbi:MAG TPA: FAD-dependent oxidoreductase [Streptosporangiaceae bacterium]